MTYFITFVCYGTHLHGDESGSVDRHHNIPGSRVLESDAKLVAAKTKLMDQPSYELDDARRTAVLEALKEVCVYRSWNLLAAHVRSNHVHTVVEAEASPEKVLNDFKSYASRRLNLHEQHRKRWAHHGSTRWLWDSKSISAAIQYVVYEQGKPMAVFVTEPRP